MPNRLGMQTFIGLFTVMTLLANTAAPADSPVDGLDFRRIVSQAKEKVFPAVIYIKCIRESHESGKKESQGVSGSGVIITSTGEALTNWHVIDKAQEVRCLLTDGRAMTAEVVGSDKDTDLALLRLTLPSGVTDLPYATIGQSTQLKEGDFVMAMGAPWGMNRSVSIGIISCTRRYLPTHSEYSLWLQTDASISPGNSGGPLLNTDGVIVGLNTRGVSSGGDMGFVVPSETIQDLLLQLRDHGKVNWSWTGLQLQPLRDFNRNIYFDATNGVIVAETDPESPARRAGIEAKDRIIKIGGQPVTGLMEEDLPAIRRMLGLLPKGTPVELEIMRGKETRTIAITPREKGRVEGEELDCPRWDFTAKAINQFDNPELYFHRKTGVFVFGIKYPGNAASSDLARQDIILKIDGREVKTLDDLKAIHKELIANVDKKHKVVFTVLRGGLLRQVVLEFSRDYEKE